MKTDAETFFRAAIYCVGLSILIGLWALYAGCAPRVPSSTPKVPIPAKASR